MATTTTQHALLLKQPAPPGRALSVALCNVQIRMPHTWGPWQDATQPTPCGICRSSSSDVDGGKWRGQVGAALVPHRATPPATPFLPVWQERLPHLQDQQREAGNSGMEFILFGGLIVARVQHRDPLHNIHVEVCGLMKKITHINMLLQCRQ